MAVRAVLAAALGAGLACREAVPAPIPPDHEGDPSPERGGTLRLASFQDIQNLDPAGPTDGLALEAQHLIFAGLVDIDRTSTIAPDLAERWTVEDGGRRYRFFLRPGTLFQDGTALTAGDVKRSVERALHPTTPNPSASYFTGIVGYGDYVAGRSEHMDGVVVEGDDRITFQLDQPDATFLAMLAMHTLRPVCRSAGDRYAARWVPCGAGPFAIAPHGWDRGTSLRLVRHEHYYRPGLPRLDAVLFGFNMPLLTQRFRFEAGELDVEQNLSQSDERLLMGDPRWKPFVSVGADVRVYGEAMNTRMPPFDNVEVRRAVASAIDREHYRLLRPGTISVLTHLVPPSVPGFDPGAPAQRYDYAEALLHMKKAGYPYDPFTGRGGWPEVVEYPLYDEGLLVLTAQLLQQDLAKIGIRIALRLVSWQAFLAIQERAGGAALSQANWEMDYPDPSSFYDPLFTTAAIGPEGGRNSAFYSNPAFDDLVARAHRELDANARRRLYREADQMLLYDAPWAFAYTTHLVTVHQPYVRGHLVHPLWPLDATDVWIDRDGATLAGGRRSP